MRLQEALSQIAEIREQMARSQLFRGYRSVTTLFSAWMAVAASLIQYFWIGEGTLEQVLRALWVWLGAAIISLFVVGIEMVGRYRRSEIALHRELTLSAVEQFLPCLIAGAMLTYAIVQWAGYSISLLPALWAMLFGLGVFASRRVLPRGTFLIGAWYLLAGMLCVAIRRYVSFSSQMAGTFGGGQALAAAVLYWTLERKRPSKKAQ